MLCPACEHEHPNTATRCDACEGELLLDGRLVLTQRLGQGGSSRTYLAEDTERDRSVALKMLDIARMDDWKRLELFKRQHTILANLSVSGVPDAYSMFEFTTPAGVQWCFEQELVPGESLQALLDRGRRFTEAECVDIFEQLLTILDALHALSPPLIHRDIKPSNLLLAPTGELCLIDFDTATGDVNDPLKRDATLVGTAGFVPIEQLAGQAVPASDLYAAAMTLVALLSRRPVTDLPVEGGRVRFEDAIQVAEPLRSVLTRLLSPGVEDRLPDVDGVREALAAQVPALLGSRSLSPTGARRWSVVEMEVRGWATDRRLAWPVDAKTSHEYSPSYGALKLLGPPKVYPRHGDIAGAWAPKLRNADHEWLTATYAVDVAEALITAIWIFETHLPGAVVRVTVHGPDDEGTVVHEAPPIAAGNAAMVLEVPVSPPRPIRRVTVDLNPAQVGTGWNEIDTVALVAQDPVHPIPVNWALKPKVPVNWALKPKMPWTQRLVYGSLGLTVLYGFIAGWLTLGAAVNAPDEPAGVSTSQVMPDSPLSVVTRSPAEVASSPILWASSLHAWSSRYNASGWSAESALGPPRVWPRHGDVPRAWAPKERNGGIESIELGFSAGPPAAEILIVESYNPGALIQVDIFDGATEETAWQRHGATPVAKPGQLLRLRLDDPRVIRRVKLTLDTRLVRGWNEIDAVGLVTTSR